MGSQLMETGVTVSVPTHIPSNPEPVCAWAAQIAVRPMLTRAVVNFIPFLYQSVGASNETQAQPPLQRAQVAANFDELAKIDIGYMAQWRRWLQRLVRRKRRNIPVLYRQLAKYGYHEQYLPQHVWPPASMAHSPTSQASGVKFQFSCANRHGLVRRPQ